MGDDDPDFAIRRVVTWVKPVCREDAPVPLLDPRFDKSDKDPGYIRG